MKLYVELSRAKESWMKIDTAVSPRLDHTVVRLWDWFSFLPVPFMIKKFKLYNSLQKN